MDKDRDPIRQTDLHDERIRDRNVTGKREVPASGTQTMERTNSERGEIPSGERIRPETGAGE